MSEITVTAKNFDREVLEAEGDVLVDFWATWCGPCRMVAPVVEEIANEGKVKVGKVNIDEQPELADRFNIAVIPTLKAFRDGKEIGYSAGYQAKEQIMKMFA